LTSKSSNPPSLLETFDQLEESTKQALADMETPLKLGLSALMIAKDRAKYASLSAEYIVAALEAAGVAVDKEQITNAFSRARDRITREIIDEEVHYKLMTKGRREVEQILTQSGIAVSFVEAGKPRSARKTLSEFFTVLSGDISICDPYYGVRSLDALELIPKTCQVRFLTAQTSEKSTALAGPFADFKKEHPQTEMRLFGNSSLLHDRYLISPDALYLLGHGIKDIGNRESFIVRLSKEYASDLITDLQSSFDTKWTTATVL
jgi:hypothetical protein